MSHSSFFARIDSLTHRISNRHHLPSEPTMQAGILTHAYHELKFMIVRLRDLSAEIESIQASPARSPKNLARGTQMIRAQRAPVKPRVLSSDCDDPLLLEGEISGFLGAGARGAIALLGPPGSGKTTAIEHLAAVFPSAAGLLLLDDPDAASVLLNSPVRLVVYTAQTEKQKSHLANYRLAGWNNDDLIEYLLAVHRPQCAAVMARIRDDDHELLGNVPELWRAVLDRLAEDTTLPDARRALHRHLEAHLYDTDLLERARSACLNAMVAADTELIKALAQLARPGFAEGLIRVLRHPPAQVMLAAERIAAELHGDGACDCLAMRLPHELVQSAASLVAQDAPAREHLYRLLEGPSWSHAMSASLLHAAGIAWVPPHDRPAMLGGAYLAGIRWQTVNLTGANLAQTDLSAADLLQANLTQANAWRANLSRAYIQAATLDEIRADEADLGHADLSWTFARKGRFKGANLERANFDGALLNNAYFVSANLTDCTFRGADLSHAWLGGDPNVSSRAAEQAARKLPAMEMAAPPQEKVRIDTLARELRMESEDLLALCQQHGIDVEKHLSSIKSVDQLLELVAAFFRLGASSGRPQLVGTDFTDANLTEANLSGLCLRTALWTGARFIRAVMIGCDLENLTFHEADFAGANLNGALLTGTSCPGAHFNLADLRHTGLADIDWEGAYLRGADLRGATFHLGSSRSGLVGSPIACEGSKTGFYTDDYDDQTYKTPEEIRKANLCGADLRGANIEGVDFYLVDLRGARLDAEQERHLRRCGAILGTRV
jgi:uncharacterized protein YjbI with pentapeptide repeats/energy-coupling factor transporter ATP-binding protein EcfA2